MKKTYLHAKPFTVVWNITEKAYTLNLHSWNSPSYLEETTYFQRNRSKLKLKLHSSFYVSLKTKDDENNLLKILLINLCNILTLMPSAACIWSKVKLLSRSSLIVFLKAVFNILIIEASLSASAELIGEIAPISNSFLIRSFINNSVQPMEINSKQRN